MWLVFASASTTTLLPGQVYSQDEAVGEIQTLQGRATVIRSATRSRENLKLGASVFKGDIVQTKPRSRLKIKLRDDSVVSLGQLAVMRVASLKISEDKQIVASAITIAKGLFRFITGTVQAERSFTVQTPTATIGIRGTDWMGEATDTLTQVFVNDGMVEVRSLDPGVEGVVVLTNGEGTVVSQNEAPTAKKRWPQAKVTRFLAETKAD